MHFSPSSSIHEGFPDLYNFTVLGLLQWVTSAAADPLVGTFGKCVRQGRGIHKATRTACQGALLSWGYDHCVSALRSHACSLSRGHHMKRCAVSRLCSERGSATSTLPCVSCHQPRGTMKKKTWKFSGPPVANLSYQVTNEMHLVRTICRCWSAHPAGHSTESWLWLPSETPSP